MVGGDGIIAEAVAEFEADFFDKLASVDEDECGAMLLREGGEFVVDLGPHGDAGDGGELVGGDFEGEIEDAALAYLDDGGGLARSLRG